MNHRKTPAGGSFFSGIRERKTDIFVFGMPLFVFLFWRMNGAKEEETIQFLEIG